MPNPSEERIIRKIKEEKLVVTEYDENRINEAIFNLTKQIEDLMAELDVWQKRKELSLVLIGIVIALSVIWGYNTNLRTRRLEINQDQIIQLIRNQQPRPAVQP